jgi:hypothetical protein
MERAEGRLSLARERRRVRVDFDAANCPNPSPFILYPSAERRGDKA